VTLSGQGVTAPPVHADRPPAGPVRSASVSAAHPGGPHVDPSPTFLAAGARSGSTLLRWMLDAHPDITCPGETDLAALVDAYRHTAAALAGAPDDGARHLVDDLMGRHLAATGKRRWCDKSLSNALHLDQLADLWPAGRFVLLHRHALDVVASGLEASVWGLDQYGFASYAQMSPTNPVVALVGYWIERTSALLRFEERNPARCLRIRYEDLVAGPDAVLGSLWSFLEVPPPADAAAAAFAGGHDASAAADYKIWFTDAVHGTSVGTGARVPADRIMPSVRAGMNELLDRLGYPTVGATWGSGDATSGVGRAGSVELRVLDGHRVVWSRGVDLDGTTVGPDGPTGPARVVVVERRALAGVASGADNPGAALRARTVRVYGSSLGDFTAEQALVVRLAPHLGDAVRELPDDGPPGPRRPDARS